MTSLKNVVLRLLGLILWSACAAFSSPEARGGGGVAGNVRFDYFRRGFADTTLTAAERIAFGDSLAAARPGRLPWALYMAQERLLNDAGRFEDALRLFSGLVPALPPDSLRMQLAARWQVAKYNFMLNRHRQALREAYALLKAPKPDSLAYFDLYPYTLFVDFFNMAREGAMAWHFERKAEALLATALCSGSFSPADSARFASLFNRLACGMLIDAGDADGAYGRLEDARKGASPTPGTVANHYLLAQIAALKGDDRTAEAYYREALDTPTHNFNRNFALMKYISFLTARGRTADAARLLAQYPGELAAMRGSVLEPSLLAVEADFYRSAGDYRREADTRRRYAQIRDSLCAVSQGFAAAELFDIPSEGAEAPGGRHGAPPAWAPWLEAVAAMAASGAAAGLHIKSKRKLAAAKAAAAGAKARLEAQGKELVAMTMQMERIEDAFDRLRQTIDDSSASTVERTEAASRLLRDLQLRDRLWEQFNACFNNVHLDFFTRLQERCPRLTRAELRMCAYIRMGLTTKEVSGLTNRSPRTVEAIKYNLRKKLAIDIPTDEFLAKL